MGAPQQLVFQDALTNDNINDNIDNHDSGYQGMAIQLYVQAHLRHFHIFTQEG